MNIFNKISVLGDGGWGTTLAIVLSDKGYKVKLWGVFRDYVKYLDRFRENKKFLPGVKIPRALRFTPDLEEAFNQVGLIVLAIPSQHLRNILTRIKELRYEDKVFLNVAKGIENNTLMTMSQVIKSELGKVQTAVLSGPTIAHEVARGIPTTCVVACRDIRMARILQGIFITPRLRVYTNTDVAGVELGGSIKNVIAIACGISDGLGFGTNTKAALLARGLAEMSRLGIRLGARKETFSGISGLGDLVTTCISPFSRNRYVGERIGKGKSLKGILNRMQMVAEGIPTTKSAYKLSLKYNVQMPITREVYRVLFKRKPPQRAVEDLMTRERKRE